MTKSLIAQAREAVEDAGRYSRIRLGMDESFDVPIDRPLAALAAIDRCARTREPALAAALIEAEAVLRELSSMMPVFPKDAANLVGMRELYDAACDAARSLLARLNRTETT